MSTRGLLDALTVTNEGHNTFTGWCMQGAPGRVFGGQVAAQALFAGAMNASPERQPHSVHLYFLRPGDPRHPITYRVTVLKQGRTFFACQVHARQGPHEILTAMCSFCVAESGSGYQEAAPAVPDPNRCPVRGAIPPGTNEAIREPWEFRDVQVAGGSEGMTPPRQRTWLRARTALVDDPVVQACALTYVSDLTLPITAHLPLHDFDHYIPGASLDHTMWFHRPFRVDGWLLFDQMTPTFAASRGLSHGRLFDATGTLVASVAQESVIRVPE